MAARHHAAKYARVSRFQVCRVLPNTHQRRERRMVLEPLPSMARIIHATAIPPFRLLMLASRRCNGSCSDG